MLKEDKYENEIPAPHMEDEYEEADTVPEEPAYQNTGGIAY